MNVLIGIPTHKRPTLLRACLESIAAQTGVAARVQLFVADNDAAEREGHELVRQMSPGFRYSLGSTVVAEPGISAVRNAILAEAQRSGVDFIAMIDDDETADPVWLSELLRVQVLSEADAVGGPVEYLFTKTPPPAIVDSGIFRRARKPEGPSQPLTGTGNFLVRSSSLADHGWPKFDNSFGLTGGGDMEWFTRLALLGLRFAWAPSAVASESVPVERLTAQWVKRRAYRCGNSDMRVWLRHRTVSSNAWTLGKAAGVLATAPLLAPGLLHSAWRTRLTIRWLRAAGKLQALLGREYREYADRHVMGGER